LQERVSKFSNGKKIQNGGPISSLVKNGFIVEVKKLREGVVVRRTIGSTLCGFMNICIKCYQDKTNFRNQEIHFKQHQNKS
jgi:hypothetical protein